MKDASLMCVGYRRTPGERRRTRRAGAAAAAGAESRRGAMRGLAGKRVVVTGGTSGIGAATAQRFRDEGSEVVVLARTPGYGVIPCDVGDRLQVDAAFEQVGDLDVLVNNAGVSVRSPAVDICPDQWDQVLATNLSGAFWVASTWSHWSGQMSMAGLRTLTPALFTRTSRSPTCSKAASTCRRSPTSQGITP